MSRKRWLGFRSNSRPRSTTWCASTSGASRNSKTRSPASARKEQEENLRKQRQREIEDYEDRKALERRKAQDKYEEEMRLLEKKNQEKQEALERSWQQREAAEARSEQQLLVMQKDAEAEKRLPELRVRTLEEALKQQTALIAALQKQVEDAKKRVQDIALKAIEGASGAKALAHINEIAIEQAKHRSPQG